MIRTQIRLLLKSGYSRIISAYDAIKEEAEQQRIKVLYASFQVSNIEQKINEQCLIVLDISKSEKEKNEAFRKVKEGMEYFAAVMNP